MRARARARCDKAKKEDSITPEKKNDYEKTFDDPLPKDRRWHRPEHVEGVLIRCSFSGPMSTAFSPAQLRASLWARQGSRVHAVIDGLVVPGIAEKLKSAKLAGWDCLQRGALSAEAAERAPYLAELGEGSPFTDWLLDEATPTYPGLGRAHGLDAAAARRCASIAARSAR